MSAGSRLEGVMDRSVGLWKSVVWASLLLAGTLSMVDPFELFSYSVTPVCFSTAEYVEPDKADLMMPPPGASVATDKDGAWIFGMDTEPVIDGALFDKWRRAKAGIAQDLEAVSRCEANGSCPAAAEELFDLSVKGAGRTERARVGLINRAVDLAISPVSDEAQWGASDHWSHPLETLQSDKGDCEDYAIVKYAALLEPVFPEMT